MATELQQVHQTRGLHPPYAAMCLHILTAAMCVTHARPQSARIAAVRIIAAGMLLKVNSIDEVHSWADSVERAPVTCIQHNYPTYLREPSI